MVRQRQCELVEQTIVAMRRRLDQDFSLCDMAGLASLSPSHFCRMFHAITGVGPCQFLGALRLLEATRLLLATRDSVTDISLTVGYSSLGTFVRRFTQLVGVSPRRLRQLAPLAAEAMETVAGLLAAQRSAPATGGPHIEVSTPPGFDGLVFVGAFAGALPWGRPRWCAVRLGAGPVALADAGRGNVLLAAGFERGVDPVRCLLDSRWVRGSALDHPGSTLALRPAGNIDPPLLLALPVVAVEMLGLANSAAVAPPAVRQAVHGGVNAATAGGAPASSLTPVAIQVANHWPVRPSDRQ